MKRILAAVALLLITPVVAGAQYLCVKAKDGGIRNGTTLRIRDMCKPREIAVGTLSGLSAASSVHEVPGTTQPTPTPPAPSPTPVPTEAPDARFIDCPCYTDFNLSHPDWMGNTFPGIPVRKTWCSSSYAGNNQWHYGVGVADQNVARMEPGDMVTRHVRMNLYAHGTPYGQYACYVATDAPAWGGGVREIMEAADHDDLNATEAAACIALWNELGCDLEP